MAGLIWFYLAGLGVALVTVASADNTSGVSWQTGAWEECNENCVQTRSVLCWDFSAGTADSTSPCPTKDIKPDTSQDCPECQCSDPMTSPQCSCNGYFSKKTAQCECLASFAGSSCATLQCPSTWTAEDCECCPSGVVSHSGKCCDAGTEKSTTVDKYGECCYAGLDGCGVCGGTGVLRDAIGQCCEEGFDIDGHGICCQKGERVDACGVCNGLSNTCGTTIRLLIVINPSMDQDTNQTVRQVVAKTLHYPENLVHIGGVEALDVTEVIPYAGVLRGEPDAEEVKDDSKDFIFGRVTVLLEKLGSEPGVKDSLVDLDKISAALKNTTHFTASSEFQRMFLVSVMRTCGDGICSPGEHPSKTTFTGPSIYGSVIYNANGTHMGGLDSSGNSGGNATWGSNSTNSAPGEQFPGTFERADPSDPPVCDSDCATACPVLPPPGQVKATPMVCAGRGSCDDSTKTCQCYAGFEGPNCSVCAKGHMLTHAGLCVPHPTMCDVPDTKNGTNTTTLPGPTPDPKGPDPRGEYVKKFSEWTSCTEKCGGGNQSRTWECMESGEPVDREMCDAPPEAELFQRCNLMPCESFQFSVSSWSACSQSCGGGYRTRKKTCLSSYGHVVNPLKCTCSGTDCTTFERCNTKGCDGPYLTFSTYSACNVVCGGGLKTRTAYCNSADGADADAAVCSDLGLQDTAEEIPCNTAACREDSFVWKTDSWSACNSATCGGTRTRTVTCRNAYTGVTASTDTACGGMKPDIEQSCEPCSFCEDPVLNENCSGKGQCVNDACDCDGVWGGAICAVDTTLCPPPGRLDPDGNCCASGVISSTGACCERQAGTDPVLDGDGNCCSAGFFDACGICGANNIGIDVFGICCPDGGIFDTQARCCASGNMDACGVCDGAGDSCKTNAIVDTATVQPASRRRQLLQTSSSELEAFFAGLLRYPQDLVTAVGTGDSSITEANITLNATSGRGSAANAIASTEDITVAMEIARTDDSAAIRIQSSPRVTKIPECGDELCSPGEVTTRGAPPPQYDCPGDCPIVLGSCPSPGSSELGNATRECGGLGSCARASLTCVCFAGFDGEACGHCAEGYRQVGEDCEIIISLLLLGNTTDPAPVSPPGEPDVQEPEVDPDVETNVGLIAGLTVLCVAITGAAVGAGYAYKTGRIGQRNRPEQFGMDASPVSFPDTNLSEPLNRWI